jgi:hypothetical protein
MVSVTSQPWLLFPIFLVGLLLVVDIGIRLRLVSEVLNERGQSLLQSAGNGLTVLLSFLLGFTLPMTLPYYEARRDLMVDEANVIATIDQRAQLLPNPYGQRIRQLLPQYVDARLDFARGGDEEVVQASSAQAARLQSAMWREMVALVHERPDLMISEIVVQVSADLSNLADLAEKRRFAYERRIPSTIWLVLALVAVLTCFVVGYSMEQRVFLAMFVLPVAVATVITLAAELESPHSGFIRVEQLSMQRLRAELRAELSH